MNSDVTLQLETIATIGENKEAGFQKADPAFPICAESPRAVDFHRFVLNHRDFWVRLWHTCPYRKSKIIIKHLSFWIINMGF